MGSSTAALRSARHIARAALVQYPVEFALALPASFRAHSALLLVTLVYWISGIIIGSMAGFPLASTITTYAGVLIVIVPAALLCLIGLRGIDIMARERPERPLTQLVLEIRDSLATPQRLAHASPMLLAMLIFGGTFTTIKASIPSLLPFTWDPHFEQLDRWLHGGAAPWEILQPALGAPIATYAINLAYNSWFICLNLIWVWQAFRLGDNRLRLQFFLSLILGWILLGSVLATLLSSAGPCFFGRVTELPDPYAPLMEYLRDVDKSYAVWALDAQELLWGNQTKGGVAIGSGISAMPSMHVAIATLFALVCWRVRRWLGVAMSAYALAIMIGSVQLGWHYAIDGYVGAAGMIAIWWGTGRCLEWHERRRRNFIAEAGALV